MPLNAKGLNRFTPLILLLGDLAAVIIFIIAGQRDHNLVNEANPTLGVLETTVEFAAPWALAGWLLGAFPRGDAVTVRSLLARSLNAWLVAAPLGILIRSFVLGRAVIPTIFVVATLGFGGLFLLGWRLAFVLVWARMARPPTPAAS